MRCATKKVRWDRPAAAAVPCLEISPCRGASPLAASAAGGRKGAGGWQPAITPFAPRGGLRHCWHHRTLRHKHDRSPAAAMPWPPSPPIPLTQTAVAKERSSELRRRHGRRSAGRAASLPTPPNGERGAQAGARSYDGVAPALTWPHRHGRTIMAVRSLARKEGSWLPHGYAYV